MFHGPMGRFQLELFFITYFSTIVLFSSCRINDERPSGKKTQLLNGTTVENR